MARDHRYDELDDQPRTTKAPRRRRASFFGFLSAVTGVAAIAVVYRDQISDWLAKRYVPGLGVDLGQYAEYLYRVQDYSVQAYHVAAAGAGLAVLALLFRRMTKRTRAGWPVLGLLLSAAAAGIYRYHSVDRVPGTPEHWVQVNVVERVQKMLDKQPANETTPVSAPPETAPAPAATPEPDKAPGGGSTLFPES